MGKRPHSMTMTAKLTRKGILPERMGIFADHPDEKLVTGKNAGMTEEAKKLLKDPALRIGDVAEKVGFLDMGHFSRVFKKMTGISANEYRNRMK